MKIDIKPTAEESGLAAAKQASMLIRSTLDQQENCNIILATGKSQFHMLAELVKTDNVDWSRVSMFHLDEYLGIDNNHPASFRKYLRERFVEKVPTLKSAFYIDGDAPNLEYEIQRLNKLIEKRPIDVAMIGIGENGHLAFNDPPADFEISDPYIVVELDEACRQQQFSEGWFESIDSVPPKAISMSIKQIMKAKNIVCTVPDERKADAVKAAVNNEVTNMLPATILQEHPNAYLFLDADAAKHL